MPDPVTVGAVVASLFSAATKGAASGVAGEAAKAAFQSLRGKLSRWAPGHVTVLETTPDSAPDRAELAASIDRQSATERQEVADLAAKLIQTVEDHLEAKQREGKVGPTGLDVEQIKAARIDLGSITVTEGTGARIRNSRAQGDFVVNRITVGKPAGKSEE